MDHGYVCVACLPGVGEERERAKRRGKFLSQFATWKISQGIPALGPNISVYHAYAVYCFLCGLDSMCVYYVSNLGMIRI